MRDGAARAIAAIGKVPADAIPHLVKMLNDPDHWWPRESAVKALGSETREVLPELIVAYSEAKSVRNELTLKDTIRRLVKDDNRKVVSEQIQNLLEESQSDWFKEKILLLLVKALGRKMDGLAPYLEKRRDAVGKDKEKSKEIAAALAAIRP